MLNPSILKGDGAWNKDRVCFSLLMRKNHNPWPDTIYNQLQPDNFRIKNGNARKTLVVGSYLDSV